MDFVFVIDDITGLKPCHDSSVALMEAAQLRGHRILITTAARLSYTDGRATALCCPVTLKPAVRHEQQWIIDPEWFTLGPASLYRLGDAAAVFMRTDPPVDASVPACHLPAGSGRRHAHFDGELTIRRAERQ